MTALLPPPLPTAADELARLYRHPSPEGRPYVRANMIGSLDGAATVDGKSGGLAGPGDRRVFETLRAEADVVLVGASTAYAEDYSTPERPALALVTRGDVQRTPRLYPEGGPEPLVYAGHGESVDLAQVLADLHGRGLNRVLTEGGPRFLGALLAAGLVDEVCLTIAPLIVGGDSRRIVVGPDLPADRWTAAHVLSDDEAYLYTRWLRRPGPRG